MKRITFLSVIFLVSVTVKVQAQFSDGQRRAQQAVVQMFDALSNRDSIALKSSCTPDVTFYEYGQVWNMDTLIRKAIRLNPSPNFKRINSFEFIETRVDKTQAWLTYRLRSVITKDSLETVVQWLETVVMERRDKQWKVKHLHSTLISGK